MQVDKSNFFHSFFHSRVFGEVKANIRYFYLYNKEALSDNKANNIILNIIENNIITDVTEGFIRTKFQSEGFIDSEIDPIIENIIEFKVGESSVDKVIDEVLKSVRKSVYKVYIDRALKEHKTDPVAFMEACRAFHYAGSISDKIKFEQFSEMNIDEIAQKELKLLFQTGLSFIDRSNALGGVVSGQLYQIVGGPGSGKSLLMEYLSVKSCEAKNHTAYIALGDLDRGAFITRMYALATNTSLMDAILEQDVAYDYVSKGDIDKYFHLAVLPSKEATIYEVIDSIRDLMRKYPIKVVFIDYDANLRQIAGSMYEEGDITYAETSRLTLEDGLAVFFGSQPKINFWNEELLDMTSANESSRKQQHVAVMVTIGKVLNKDGTPAGKLAVVKDRVGKETEQKYLRCDSGRFVEVDGVTYATYRDAKIGRVLSYQEIVDEVRYNVGNPDAKPKDEKELIKSKEEQNALNLLAKEIPDAK